jgi:ribose 5-phosphate isomerase B
MRIAISSDHAGYGLKEVLVPYLKDLGHQVLDLGTNSEESVDYPDFVELVGRAVQKEEVGRGIIICGSGVGACIAANKMKGIYAAICHDVYSAKQGVEHDDMNVICLGGRIIGEELAKVLVQHFLEAEFLGKKTGQERHQRRVNKIKDIESKG